MKPHVLLALFLACFSGPVLADDTAFALSGGSPEPMEDHPTIVMEKMDVEIDLLPGYAEFLGEADVNCTFIFRNTGEEATVGMGFPESGFATEDRGYSQGFKVFTTWVDGEEVPTTIEGLERDEGEGWHRWRVKAVHFAAHHTRTVRVYYRAPFNLDGLGNMQFTYEVSSGASWKGPIPFARVRLRLHPDRGLGEFHMEGITSRFSPCGPNLFEWVKQDFEPTAQDDVRVGYRPGYKQVMLGDFQLGWAVSSPYRAYIKNGVLWLTADVISRAVRAELTQHEAEVTLVRGATTVSVREHLPWLEVDGHRISLPEPPRVNDSGVLWMPGAPVLRALGADVAFDVETAVVNITYPMQRAIDSQLEDRLGHSPINGVPLGWAPPEPEEYHPEVLAYVRTKGQEYPWVCFGDFNGDGAKDSVLDLRKRDQVGLGIVESRSRHHQFRWLAKPSKLDQSEPGALLGYLQTRPPGIVQYWTEHDWRTGHESGRLDLTHDGIEITGWGKAATLHYWDDEDRRYRNVQIAR